MTTRKLTPLLRARIEARLPPTAPSVVLPLYRDAVAALDGPSWGRGAELVWGIELAKQQMQTQFDVALWCALKCFYAEERASTALSHREQLHQQNRASREYGLTLKYLLMKPAYFKHLNGHLRNTRQK